MKAHTKIYLEYFGFEKSDFIPCEICGATAVDIHHIEARGMGGSKTRDVIENLMAVCRSCHIEYGDKVKHKEYVIEVHNKYIKK
jgi:hypothetical protein